MWRLEKPASIDAYTAVHQNKWRLGMSASIYCTKTRGEIVGIPSLCFITPVATPSIFIWFLVHRVCFRCPPVTSTTGLTEKRQSKLGTTRTLQIPGLYVGTQSPLGWYGREKFGVTITFNWMGSIARGWYRDGMETSVYGDGMRWDGMGNF